MQRIGLDLRKHLFTPGVLMGRKPPFKILGSSDSTITQEKSIFLLVKAIISPEKNPRKPVSRLNIEGENKGVVFFFKPLELDLPTYVIRHVPIYGNVT
jgi:hypothetical protein